MVQIEPMSSSTDTMAIREELAFQINSKTDTRLLDHVNIELGCVYKSPTGVEHDFGTVSIPMDSSSTSEQQVE